MTDLELIPPKLPELFGITATGASALQPVMEAATGYDRFRRHYESTARTFRQYDIERRQQQHLQQNLPGREAELTEQLKNQLVTEHLKQRNKAPAPPGETREQLAERLLNERYEREPTHSTRRRFHLKNLLPGRLKNLLPERRRANQPPSSEELFDQLRSVQRAAVTTRDRLKNLNERSGGDLATTEVAFRTAAQSLDLVSSALREAEKSIGEMSVADRQALKEFRTSLAVAYIRTDAGQATFNAHSLAQLPPALRMHHELRSQLNASQGEPMPPMVIQPRRRSDHPLSRELGAPSHDSSLSRSRRVRPPSR